MAYFLPRALFKLGVDVRIFTPKYGTINEKKFPTKMVAESVKVPTGENDQGNQGDQGDQKPRELICNVKVYGESLKSEPTVYFLENREYFEQRANVYGYSDDHIRFGLLSRGAVEFIKTGAFVPDIIHANDWHTGYLINYLADETGDRELKKIATVFTVHNIYQGIFDFDSASELDADDGQGPLASFYSDRFYKQNALKRAIIRADLVNTVSENYARELMSEEYSRTLYNLFRELRGKLFGVLNGLDQNEFNPQTDKFIKANYNARSLGKRGENKTDLQRHFGLKENPAVPLLAISGRLDTQKGIDLIVETIEFLLAETEIQLVVLGSGEDRFRQFFAELEKKWPGRVGTHLQADFKLPRKIFAGADILLLPSKYEPGGIVAVEGMRYGAVPVVRATGGLADSVIDYEPGANRGTGFTFTRFSRENFLMVVVRALEAYKHKDEWARLVRRTMEQDFSWEKTARKYFDLYQRAEEFRREALRPNPPAAFRQTIS